MEIKKGISQMAEYPNVEINYVMSNDGRMYYVLKEGVLANGCIIATLDPKYAIDEANPSTSVGVFSATGEVLVDFDKKSIKAISDDLVLAVNSKLNTPEVIGVAGREDDPMTSNTVNASKTVIINKLKEEMGPNGELLFEDPYSEANIYRIDTYNDKLGNDSSFIGKSEKGLFFHTNDAKSTTQIVEIDDFKSDENVVIENASDDSTSGDLNLDIDSDLLSGFSIPDEDLEKVAVDSETEEDNNMVSSEEVAEEVEEDKQQDDIVETVEENTTENDNSDDEVDTKEDDSSNSDEESPEQEDDEVSDANDLDIEQKDINLNIDDDNNDYREEMDDVVTNDESSDNEVLDNAISVINKMIKETNKLKDKIKELEEELEEKEKIIKESESKKDELNEILDKANEVLDEID